MKNILILVLGFLGCAVNAQLNMPGIPYQAVVREVDGTAMSDTNVEVRFTLRNLDALNGLVVHQEQHALTTNNQGLMHATIGEGVVLNGNFQTIDWSILPKFLQVEFRQTGLGEYLEMGNQQLMSVPYALYSSGTKLRVSNTGDTLTIGNAHLIVPGVSVANSQPIILGCTDQSACNFNALSNTDDGSCILPGQQCDDSNWFTISDVINQSCICAGEYSSNGVFSLGNGLTDIEGREYLSIVIGSQEWMAENLAVTTYNNGNLISTDWNTNSLIPYGACAYYADNIQSANSYGVLYNAFAAKSNNLCPTGWHVPSISEWGVLVTYLGGGAMAGGKMKSVTGWEGNNVGATNLSGFTGLPAGYRSWQGSYLSLGVEAAWWSTTSYDALGSQNAILNINQTSVNGVNGLSNWSGLSVRCLKD